MDSVGSFERLVRMVQETGERMVVSLDPGREPVVLLPFSAYEQLVQRGSGVPVIGNLDAPTPIRAPQSAPPYAASASQRDGATGADPRSSRRLPVYAPPSFTPSAATSSMSVVEHDDPADVWDGETGEEYDSERIFAAATGIPRGNEVKLTSSFATPHTPPIDRMKPSISRASEASGIVRQGGGQMGSGGQRLPIRNEALRGEERFSLGAG